MNELYTANIALSVFAMAIMLFSLRGDISQSKIRNLLCGGLYATIAICALCEWSGVQMDGTPPALIPLHIAVKTIELSLAPLSVCSRAASSIPAHGKWCIGCCALRASTHCWCCSRRSQG